MKFKNVLLNLGAKKYISDVSHSNANFSASLWVNTYNARFHLSFHRYTMPSNVPFCESWQVDTQLTCQDGSTINLTFGYNQETFSQDEFNTLVSKVHTVYHSLNCVSS